VNKRRNSKKIFADTKTGCLIRGIYSFLNNTIFKELHINSSKDGIEFWKNRTFSLLAFFSVFLCAPLIIYGAYLFYIGGFLVLSITEVAIYVVICIIINLKALKIDTRKILTMFSLYGISLVLLIYTGPKGAGMVCVLFSLILAASLLNKRQNFIFFSINIMIYIALTYLLRKGYFKGFYFDMYGGFWYINAITTQVCGIILIYLMSIMYNGLEKQTQKTRKSKELLFISEAKHKAMIASISDVIFIVDESGKVKYSSPNMIERYGWSEKDFQHSTFWDKVYSEDREKIKEEFNALLEKDSIEKTFEARFQCKDGAIIYLEITANNMIEDVNIQGILMNNHDITERKKREEKVIYLNYHDPLTGVYNRRYLENELSKVDRENELPISIISGDINGLKFINDALGHKEGDKLLITIAQILTNCCRKEDTLFRVGGDEFLILLPKTTNEDAYKIVEKIYSYCEKYNKEVSNELYYTSISLGVATKIDNKEKIQNTIKHADDSMYMRKLLEVKSIHNSILASMQRALFEKSQETEMHANRLAKMSKKIGEAIGLTSQQFDELELLAKLHDIGKIGVDDQILNKPGSLTEDEWEMMKKHSEIGYRIAQSSVDLIPIAKYILYHHERWDGKGYPQGLKGEDIPLLSRIISVVDAYDAMTEDRIYRKGMSKEEAINIIKRNSGSQFDNNIVEIFLEVVED
jgi:diguanylate cyclase (GGDEF)-like protein/PAS domain S-box-containing protein